MVQSYPIDIPVNLSPVSENSIVALVWKQTSPKKERTEICEVAGRYKNIMKRTRKTLRQSKGASTLLVLVLVLARLVTVHIEVAPAATEIRCVLLQAWRARVMWTRLKAKVLLSLCVFIFSFFVIV
jgi:hypothetical protein